MTTRKDAARQRALVSRTLGFPTLGFPTLGFPTLGFPTLGFPTLGFPTLGLATLLLSAAAAAGQPGAEPRVTKLIQQLGDADFATRQEATEELLRVGPQAIGAVETATRSADPETRSRAAALLPRLLQRRFEERIDRFLRGGVPTAATTSPDLPGWQAFTQTTGARGASRRAYARMYRADPNLIDAAFAPAAIAPSADPKRLMLMLDRRLNALQDHTAGRPTGAESADLFPLALASLFVAANHPGAVSDRGSQLLVQAAKAEVVPVARQGDGPHATAARGVLSGWITGSRSEGLYVLSQMLRIADDLQLEEAAPIAAAIALGERTVRPAHPQFRASALLILGRLGDHRHADRLMPLLEDDAVCAAQAGRTGNVDRLLDIEVRDVALAVMAHLRGETPRAVGLVHARPHEDRLFVMRSLGFTSQPKRTAAIEHWRADRLLAIAAAEASLRVAENGEAAPRR